VKPDGALVAGGFFREACRSGSGESAMSVLLESGVVTDFKRLVRVSRLKLVMPDIKYNRPGSAEREAPLDVTGQGRYLDGLL
jgi:hypothetical protein